MQTEMIFVRHVSLKTYISSSNKLVCHVSLMVVTESLLSMHKTYCGISLSDHMFFEHILEKKIFLSVIKYYLRWTQERCQTNNKKQKLPKGKSYVNDH